MSRELDKLWIVIPNWGRFQHYKDRDPSWIKVYTELNSRDEWFHLSWAQRGILTSIWIEYAASRCRLRVDQVNHLAKTWLRPGDLESLVHAGFVELSSRPPARPRAREKGLLRKPKRGASETATETGRASTPRKEKPEPPAAGSQRHGDPARTVASLRSWIESPGFDPDTFDDEAVLEEIERRERKAGAELDDEQRDEVLALARWRRDRS